jgi:hypothetical protein
VFSTIANDGPGCQLVNAILLQLDNSSTEYVCATIALAAAEWSCSLLYIYTANITSIKVP